MRAHLLAILLASAALIASIGNADAATQGYYDRAAQEAARSGQQTVSLYVDVDFGARKTGAATELNQAHRAFNANGYRLVDVAGYTENGDLQGFFVTYARG
ncbi:hypothetical protein [Marilutibacter aestuarii]|uniref:DUF4148 domain-containing protein n=1 Tax=Marilutibacter aestuarii TaxID=1706195 RepID=A0A507ZXT3_9GAMM|nr:hypothetical protein [Lysobacter aestuarii]TQD41064.1 hypothetical protein FKV25_13550 [Lysobacter aestuarii]